MAEAVKEVNISEFDELLNHSESTIFCDFWASWCGPCRMLSPIMDELAVEYNGKAVFVKVNVDENEDLAMRYNIYSIPNVVAFKKGNVAESSLGFVPKEKLKDFIERNL